MKHLFAFIVAICFCNLLFAQQRISLGLKGGMNIPGLGINSSDPVISGYKTELSPYYGVELECGLNKRWSILEEVNYANTTITKNGSQVIPQSAYDNLSISSGGYKYLYADFYSKIQLKYVEMPMMLKYYVYQKKQFNFFVNGGFFVGIPFYGNVKTTGVGKVYTDEAHTSPLLPFKISLNQQENIEDRLKPINVGLQAGFGVTLNYGIGEFFANASGNLGFMNIQENSGDGANKTKEATLAVGYLFHLSK